MLSALREIHGYGLRLICEPRPTFPFLELPQQQLDLHDVPHALKHDDVLAAQSSANADNEIMNCPDPQATYRASFVEGEADDR
jgi:hypothetical protein